MKSPAIISTAESDEYFFEEGCYILELSNSGTDPDVSIARARVAPGTETKLHALADTIERYLILQGEGEVTLGHLPPQRVTTNDVVLIPEDCPQAIRNCGNRDLIFLVICSPRFISENYRELAANNPS